MAKGALHKRSVSRLAAVQGLYQVAVGDVDFERVTADFQKHFSSEILGLMGSKKYDVPFFESLVEGTLENLDTVDRLLEKALPEAWPLERLDHVVRSILRCAAFELCFHLETDRAIIFNEYLNVTHAFFNEKEPAFVNGVLHKVSLLVAEETA